MNPLEPLTRRALALALAACTWILPLPGQGEPPSTPPASAPAKLEKLAAWPEVPKEAREQLAIDVERLRKAHTDEMGEQARAGLLATGVGAVPSLLRALEREESEEGIARVSGVLAELTTAAHTRLLAKEFEGKSPRVREWCLMRCALFPDPALRAAADKALERARKARPRETTPTEIYAASLCAASAGSVQGFDALFEAARKQWGKRAAELRTALEGVRGKEATAKLAPHIDSAERTEQVAALNMLAGCGDRESAVGLVRPFLDQTDGGLLTSAINALRGIVDGQPPIDRLAVFEAVGEAKKWKARL